jgi:phosphoenolpyruvate carboxykinase (ATP)
MINLLDIRTPAQPQAAALKSDYGLDNHGLFNAGVVYWNLSAEALYEEIVFRHEGTITRGGAIVMNTGKHTARSANDKFVVREPSTEEHVWWGQYNRPFAPAKFNELFSRMQGFLQGRDVFVQDCYVGDSDYRMPVRIVTEHAWHSLFARNMFIPLKTNEEYRRHVPDFTVICCPAFKGIPQIDGTVSNTFITLNFDQRICVIGNTAYAGEIKKSVFTVMNYLMPLRALPDALLGEPARAATWRCSSACRARARPRSRRTRRGASSAMTSTAGATTACSTSRGAVTPRYPLSAVEPRLRDPPFAPSSRTWSRPVSRRIDLDDPSLPRTRGRRRWSSSRRHPRQARGIRRTSSFSPHASGVMPPIAKLSVDQARYQFISGYTSKIAGTEVGLGKEPEITFSTCFGAPFMVHQPDFYARLLKEKVLRYGADCWLVNTGWVGGQYGVGKRISIRYTRAMLNAALGGKLKDVEFHTDPVFGFQVPKTCPGVPDHVLDPASSWPNRDLYFQRYRQLAARFIDNFKKFDTAEARGRAGPV